MIIKTNTENSLQRTLKDEITARANQFLAAGHVKGAYFTEFIIQ